MKITLFSSKMEKMLSGKKCRIIMVVSAWLAIVVLCLAFQL